MNLLQELIVAKAQIKTLIEENIELKRDVKRLHSQLKYDSDLIFEMLPKLEAAEKLNELYDEEWERGMGEFNLNPTKEGDWPLP
jgi:hypothetical protein